MCLAVNEHGAHAANTFSAIVVKRNRISARANDLVIHHVHHFQERHIRTHITYGIRLHAASILWPILSPNFQCQIHVIQLFVAPLLQFNVLKLQVFFVESSIAWVSRVFPR